MNTLYYTTLFIVGTLWGSFASVLIYRLKSREKGILWGRSHCAKCERVLNVGELVPLISWILNKGKCSTCKKQISKIYPLLECSMGILFVAIGYFLTDIGLLGTGDIQEGIKLLSWLLIGFITIVYIFYDILFLEIHEGVLLSGVVFILLLLVIQTLFHDIHIIPNSSSENIPIYLGVIASVGGLSTIGGLYLIMLKGFKEIWDIGILIFILFVLYLFSSYSQTPLSSIPILNGVIGALGIFIFFFLQIVVSNGKWMGGGDLRIGIMIGLVLGATFSWAGIMISYCVGSIISIYYILYVKYREGWNTKCHSQIPFGPFLGIGFFVTIFYQSTILNFIEKYFFLM